jgi:hypothetical protein
VSFDAKGDQSVSLKVDGRLPLNRSTMLGLLEIEIYDSIVLAWAVAALIAVGLLGITLFGKALLLRRLPEPRPTGDLGWREVLRELVIRTWTLFLIIAVTPGRRF